jgi:hypothetical protein
MGLNREPYLESLELCRDTGIPSGNLWSTRHRSRTNPLGMDQSIGWTRERHRREQREYALLYRKRKDYREIPGREKEISKWTNWAITGVSLFPRPVRREGGFACLRLRDARIPEIGNAKSKTLCLALLILPPAKVRTALVSRPPNSPPPRPRPRGHVALALNNRRRRSRGAWGIRNPQLTPPRLTKDRSDRIGSKNAGR